MLLWNTVEHLVNPEWFPIRKLRFDSGFPFYISEVSNNE